MIEGSARSRVMLKMIEGSMIEGSARSRVMLTVVEALQERGND